MNERLDRTESNSERDQLALDGFASQLNVDRLIAADIDSLSDEFDVDAASHVAALKRDALDDARRDPRYQANATRVGQARIALRRRRIDAARRLQSNGVEETRHALDQFLWDSRLVDFFVADLRQGEKLVEVSGFALVTNMRVRTRDELKRACRMSVEMNDANFARNFTSDEKVREVEARLAEVSKPVAPGSTGVSNSDWPRR
jgi:hypothetical protein